MSHKDPKRRSEYNREYAKKNKDRIRENKRRYRRENKDIVNEYKRRYYQKNGQKKKEYDRKYYQSHKEEISKKNHEYREKHLEELKEASHQWYERNKSRVKESNRKYLQKDENKLRANELKRASYMKYRSTLPFIARYLVQQAERRAKQCNLEFSISKEYIFELLKGQPNCPVFNIPFQYTGTRGNRDWSPSLDRLVPTKGYTKENIRLISWRANGLKNDGTAAEHRAIADWMDSQGATTL